MKSIESVSGKLNEQCTPRWKHRKRSSPFPVGIFAGNNLSIYVSANRYSTWDYKRTSPPKPPPTTLLPKLLLDTCIDRALVHDPCFESQTWYTRHDEATDLRAGVKLHTISHA